MYSSQNMKYFRTKEANGHVDTTVYLVFKYPYY